MSHIHCNVLFLTIRRQPSSTLFPYTTLFRSGSVTSLHGVPPAAQPVLHGRLHALGFGKDSTAGHWELMGVVLERPFPTYPSGFPPEVLQVVTAASGRGVLCNAPSNGIEAIERFGAAHLETGSLIVY